MFAFLSHVGLYRIQRSTIWQICVVFEMASKCAVHKRNATSKTMLVLSYTSSVRPMSRDRSYSIQQVLRAISHSLGAHATAFDVVLDASDAEDDNKHQQRTTIPTQRNNMKVLQGRQRS